jgi:predicted nucleic acid-binding protein
VKLFLDANVLYPQLVRGALLSCARSLGWQLFWSERVFTEWRIAVARNLGLEAEQTVVTAQAELREDWPAAVVVPDPAVEDEITLPDPADAHVLAGAIAGQAQILVTFNLRDFPRRKLSAWEIETRHPDSLLWQAVSDDPTRVVGALTKIAEEGGIAPDTLPTALKRARLPRLAKALRGHTANAALQPR